MKICVNVGAFPRICTIFALFVFIIAMPVSAITQPTIDTVTPSTTSVVNGGSVIITFTGTCGAQITQASFGMITPQSVSQGTFIQTTTNGNQWTGQAEYTFSPNAPSGQYKIGRITIQDAAGNYVSKDFIPEIIINVQNSVPAQSPISTTTQTTFPTTMTVTPSDTAQPTIAQTTAATTIPITTSTIVQTTDLTTEPTTPIITMYTTALPTRSPTPNETLKKVTPWTTYTPIQPSPLGGEIGIIATFGAALLIMKRK